MEASDDRHLERGWQYGAYLGISLLSLGLAAILSLLPGSYFPRFFGSTPPFLVISIVSGLGVVALWILQTHFSLVLFMGQKTLRGLVLSAALATLLAGFIVIADFIIRYPEEMNVPFPQALLFYPAIGFVAEIVFHLLPLTLLLLVLKPARDHLGRSRTLWIALVLVAATEPTFQVVFEPGAFTWRDGYTWVHVYVMSILQLYVFQRFDFVSMYAFRLVYYVYWHILWGVIRLDVLF